MNTTLAIIDVQPRFEAAAHIVPRVVHQIDLARRRQDGVIVVELNGRSHDEIYKALHGYNRHTITKKKIDDGSDNIIWAARSRNYSLNRIRLCGVNTCACVKSTIYGLNKSNVFGRIEAAYDAINCTHSYRQQCLEDLETAIRYKYE
jgi:nicotinamidase-related amidase